MTTLNRKELINESLKKAVGGGTAGTIAMGTQVISLMWLRTTVNYQYKNGTTFKDTLKILIMKGVFGVFIEELDQHYYKHHFPDLEIQQ